MTYITSLLTNLRTLNEPSKSLSNPASVQETRTHINSIHQVLKKSKTIKSRLKSMDNTNSPNRLLLGFGHCTPIDRTRTSVTNGICRKKIQDLIMEFEDLRQKMMFVYKETVERRYYSDVYMNSAVVYEIQDRYDAAREIEKSLLELHQVFLHVAVMVEVQGEKMDDIKHHVVAVGNYVRNIVKELKVAETY